MYTQDAGVPQLPMEFFEDLTYYFDIDKHNSFFVHKNTIKIWLSAKTQYLSAFSRK